MHNQNRSDRRDWMGGDGFAYDYFISRRGTAAALAREAADVMDLPGTRSGCWTTTSLPPASSCATSTTR